MGKGHAAAGFSAGREPGAAAVEGLAAAAGFAAGFAFAGFLAAFFAAFFFAGFFAAFFAAFFTAFFAAFLAGFFAAFLAAGFFAAFFAAGFFAAFFAAGFFAAAFFTAGFLAAGFFAAGFFAVAMIFLLHEESKKLPTKKPVCTSPDYSSAQASETSLALMNALLAARSGPHYSFRRRFPQKKRRSEVPARRFFWRQCGYCPFASGLKRWREQVPCARRPARWLMPHY